MPPRVERQRGQQVKVAAVSAVLERCVKQVADGVLAQPRVDHLEPCDVIVRAAPVQAQEARPAGVGDVTGTLQLHQGGRVWLVLDGLLFRGGRQRR